MKVLTKQSELRDTKHEEEVSFKCGQCGQVKPVGINGGTGYGYMQESPDAKPICYECCGENDRKSMIETGKAVLYLTCESAPKMLRQGKCRSTSGHVSNWPGTLKFPCGTRVGRHNIAGTRYDCWFRGPDGHEWHGVMYGENTQICRCKRTKAKA
jgi:hypothetical protein